MKRLLLITILSIFLQNSFSQTPRYDKTRKGFLVFHPIKTDKQGKIISWISEDPAVAYDYVVNKTWQFWDTMRRDINGLPYYMNHQVWRPLNDPRGAGGDQFAMALSSWQVLYQYNGSEKVKENMKFIADYYLSHSLSSADSKWPNIPFPYNTLIYSGIYDGDMVIGKDSTQPDKAGSFGWELIKLYKITKNDHYLQAAIKIANTLAMHTTEGDDRNSPLPFKVNVRTGEVGYLKHHISFDEKVGVSSYCSNFSGTLELFLALEAMKQGKTNEYRSAFDKILAWMKEYPMKNNKWGPFFEDIAGWSDTQINAVTFAKFIMEHRALFPEWKSDVKNIFDWVYTKLGNDGWKEYGVKVVNEQTAYTVPGNSHSARQAAAELLYASITGDMSNKELAIRQLNWATYMVDRDGKNNYPRDEVWLTDGYGDYIRHYLNSMAVFPELAPSKTHIVHSTSIVSQADYAPDFNKKLDNDVKLDEFGKVFLYYRTFDNSSTETIRLPSKPAKVMVSGKEIKEIKDLSQEGWQWQALPKGGVLKINHTSGNAITIYKS